MHYYYYGFGCINEHDVPKKPVFFVCAKMLAKYEGRKNQKSISHLSILKMYLRCGSLCVRKLDLKTVAHFRNLVAILQETFLKAAPKVTH
jgi:hypothetical protein